MKKVCIIIPSLEKGGIQNYLLRFLNHLEPDDFELTILYKIKRYDENESIIEPKVKNVLFKPLGYLNIINFFKYLLFFKRQKFDVLLDFGGDFAGIPMLLAKVAGIPKRIAFYRRSSHAFQENNARRLYSILINQFVFSYSTKILSNSQTAINFYFKNKIGSKKFMVLQNGVDPNVFKPLANTNELRRKYSIPLNKFVIGHVGRYDVAKNHKTVFEVIKKLDDSYHFVFCGLNTDSKEFILQCESKNIMDRISILGIQGKITEVLNTFDLFYFPSITEGQPNALIEAILCRIPVLTSNIDSIREIFDLHFQDLLVRPNSVDQAIDRIQNKSFIYLNADEMESFKEKFDSVKQFDKLKSIIHE